MKDISFQYIDVIVKRFTYSIRIPTIEIDLREDQEHLNKIITFSLNELCHPSHIVSVPQSWWDAFKERWFPSFLLKYFPINHRDIQTYNLCPHIDCERKKHIKFIVSINNKEHYAICKP